MDIAHLRAVFTGDTSNLDRAFDSADRKIKSFAARWTGQPKVSIYGDDSPLSETLRKATAKLNAWAAKSYSTKLDADSSGFNRTFSEASRMGDKSMSDVNRSVDGARANAARGININVGTQGASQTVTQLAGVGTAAKTVDASDPKISVSTNGVVKSTGELLTLHKVVQMVHSRSNLRFSANIDRNLSMLLPKVLGDSIHVLKSLETVGAAIHAIMVPSLIGALGGLGAAFVPVAGAAFSLGIGLAEGLAGGIGVVGMAAGLGGAALVGYGVAVNGVLGMAFGLTTQLNQQRLAMDNANKAVDAAGSALASLTPGTHEYELAARGMALAEQNAAFETAKMAAYLKTATPAVQGMIGSANNFTLAWIGASGAVANEMAPTLTTFINYATSQLPGLTGHAIEMARGMDGVALSLLDVYTRGQTLASLQTILFGIKAAGVPALRAVGNAGQILLNVLAPLVPYANDLLWYISRLTAIGSDWTKSAEGQRTIGAVWQELVGYAVQLWQAALNVAQGIWGIIMALRQAGIVDYMFQAFVRLTEQFAAFTAVGTDGQSKLTSFFQITKPILEALGRLFGEAVYQAYRIITAITGIEAAAPGLSGITGIIDAITASLEPIADLIINNFTKLAPLIAPLIVNIAKLAEVFLAAIPPLMVFIQILNTVFTWFTSLEPATQRLIAGMLSWVIVLGKLGILATVGGWIGGVVGWIAKFVMGTTTLRAGLMGVAAAFGPIGTVIGTFIGALVALNPAAWAVVAAIGAVAAAAYLIYQNWETVGPWLGEQWNNLLMLAQTVWGGIQAAIAYIWPPIRDTIVAVMTEIWTFLQQIWGQITSWWTDTIMAGMNDSTGMTFQDIWNNIKYYIDQVWSFLQYIFPIIQAGWQLMWDNIKTVVTAVWEIIKGVVQGALYIIQGIITVVMGIISGDTQMQWDGIKLIIQGVWEIIKGVINGALTLIKGVVLAGWNYLASITSSIWTMIKDGLYAIWEQIKANIYAVLGPIVNYIYGQWTYIYNNAVYYWNLIYTTIANYAQYIYDAVWQRIQDIVNYLYGQWTYIYNNVLYYWNLIVQGIAYYASLIYNTIVSYIQPVVNYLYGQWNYIYNNAVYYWNLVQQQIGYYASLIYNTVMSYVEPIVNYLYQRWNYIYNNVVYYWNLIQSYIYGVWNYVYNETIGWVRSLVDDCVAWFTGLPDKIRTALLALEGYVTGPFQLAYDAVVGNSYVPDLTSETIREFGEMVSWASSNMSQLTEIISGPFADANVYAGQSLDALNVHVIHTFGEVIDYARAKMVEFANLAVTYINQVVIAFAKLSQIVTTVSSVMAQADSVFARYLSNMATNAVNIVNQINAAFSKIRTPTMRASGGTVSGYAEGGIVAMASGGTVDRGGFSGGARGIRAITGETGTEAVIAKTMPKSSQMGFLQTAASWFDSVVVPKVPGLAGGGFSSNGTISRPNVTFNRSRASGPSMGDFNVAINVNGADYADREALIDGIRSMAHDEFTALMNTMLNGASQRRASMARGF